MDDIKIKTGELWYINDKSYVMGDSLIDVIMIYKEAQRGEVLPEPVRKAKYVGIIRYQDK